MAIPWKPLFASHSADAQLPVLLISAAFGSDSYTIHLTDLTYIWSESLDHRAILRRSQKDGTSIDPRDEDQLQIFLDKLQSGVEGGKGTSLALTFDERRPRPEITLHITVNLPGGLDPLEWPMYLSAAPESLLTSQLTVPLLEAQHARMREITSLEEVLMQKDHVIQKLVDKLEEQGTQLGQIFPQAAGKPGRKVDRTKAEEKVKGLGPFNINIWRNSLDSEKSWDTTQLVQNVFGSEASQNPKFLTATNPSVRKEDWWKGIRGETIDLSSRNTEASMASRSNKVQGPSRPVLKPEDSFQDLDGFQVQSTPPRPPSPSAEPAVSKPIDDDTTDDDDDLHAPSQSSRIPDSFPTSPPPVSSPQKQKKLGVIGGGKAIKVSSPAEQDNDEATSPTVERSYERQPSPVQKQLPPKKKGGLGRIGGKKEPPPSPPREPTPPHIEPPKSKRGKLGQLGGKKKETASGTSDPQIQTNSESPIPPPSMAQSSTEKVLGTTGGLDRNHAKESSAEPKQEPVMRGRSTKVEKDDIRPPRETSEERADRKRLELKRELEAKAKAPVKKKRKF